MDATATTLIAAASALGGAIIGVAGGFGIELWRAKQALRKEAAERLEALLAGYIGSSAEWILMVIQYITAGPTHPQAAGFIKSAELASAESRVAENRLELVAPDVVREWLREKHRPAVKGFRAALNAGLKQMTSANIDAINAAAESYMTILEEARPMLREQVRLLRSGQN